MMRFLKIVNVFSVVGFCSMLIMASVEDEQTLITNLQAAAQETNPTQFWAKWDEPTTGTKALFAMVPEKPANLR